MVACISHIAPISPYTARMRTSLTLLVCVSLATFAVHCEAQQSVTLTGFVTRASSPSDFDVNAIHILCGAKTETTDHSTGNLAGPGCPKQAMYVGEPIEVHGKFHSENRSLSAKTIEIPHCARVKVSGSAVIDGMPTHGMTGTPAGNLLVRADGYWILIRPETNVVWVAPLSALADVQSGDWIDYKGVMRADGTIVAQDARFSRLTVSTKEGKFRTQNEYDPL